jgi:hypothetical protein
MRHVKLIIFSYLYIYRRIFTICFTAIFFHGELTYQSITGIFIAITGVWLFGYIIATVPVHDNSE